MSEPVQFFNPAYMVLRCDLVLGGVQASAAIPVHRDLLTRNPAAREHAERELRLAVAREIVDKVAPPVFEERDGTYLQADARISRAEALRLAQAHTSALADLSSRLEAAGENYALMDARQAVQAGRALVAKLDGHEGRLPVRPGEKAAR